MASHTTAEGDCATNLADQRDGKPRR